MASSPAHVALLASYNVEAIATRLEAIATRVDTVCWVSCPITMAIRGQWLQAPPMSPCFVPATDFLCTLDWVQKVKHRWSWDSLDRFLCTDINLKTDTFWQPLFCSFNEWDSDNSWYFDRTHYLGLSNKDMTWIARSSAVPHTLQMAEGDHWLALTIPRCCSLHHQFGTDWQGGPSFGSY